MGQEILFVVAESVFDPNYWADKGIGLIIAIVQAIIISAITAIVLNKAFQKEKEIGRGLRSYGIEQVRIDAGTLSPKAKAVLFGENGHPTPLEVNLCFITGSSFFADYHERLVNLVKNGCKIKVLIGKPEGEFSHLKAGDIEKSDIFNEMFIHNKKLLLGEKKPSSFLEREFLMLTKGKLKLTGNKLEKNKIPDFDEDLRKILYKKGDHVYQVINAASNLLLINEELGIKDPEKEGQGIQVRYYVDEYQMPIIIAKLPSNNKKKKDEMIYLWTNINSPIKETRESINVFCKYDIFSKEKENLVKDVITYFDYLFEQYKEN